MKIEKYNNFEFSVYPKISGQMFDTWNYVIFDRDSKTLNETDTIESKEWFETEQKARFAAIGHIAILEKRGKSLSICKNENTEVEEKFKSQFEKLENKIRFLENVSLVLGITHGALSEIISLPDEELRPKLTDLFHKLSKDIGELFYKKLEKSINQ